MSYQSVEAVFFWQYGKANFSAAYGREPGGTTYSKDYLQVRRDVREVMDEVLERGARPEIPVTYAWPGGVRTDGTWREKNSATDDRGELAWLKQNGPPEPWRVGDPSVQDEVTIPGDPTATNPPDADAVFVKIQADRLDPWLVAVKLYDDPKLHLRAYMERPPAGSEGRGTTQLPEDVQREMSQVASGSCGVVRYDRGPVVRAKALGGADRGGFRTGPERPPRGPPGDGQDRRARRLRVPVQGGTVRGI